MVSIEFNGKEALGPSDDGEVSIVEEEVPVADIVDEVSDDLQMVVESNSQIDEMPNKSYASIVSMLLLALIDRLWELNYLRIESWIHQLVGNKEFLEQTYRDKGSWAKSWPISYIK